MMLHSKPTTAVKDLSGLEELKKLKVLVCFDGKLQDASAVAGLTNLEVLSISGAATHFDFSFLAKLKKLRVLDLSFTRFAEPDLLTSFPALQKVNLGNTPLAENESMVAEVKAMLPRGERVR
ncbi:MAG: hypothetical protein HN348_23625 [Proteobacteria bacterium]|nr:hypothetical protein [Pseudomonadota bacterium]